MIVCRSPAHHLGTRALQDIFTTHEARLFHWVEDKRVPADNNRAERDLRPTVIARKVSFGSSSDAGAETRSVLMSVLHTLNKGRGKGPSNWSSKTSSTGSQKTLPLTSPHSSCAGGRSKSEKD